MAAATLNLQVDYGSSWEFQATFPNSLSLVGAAVLVEVGYKKNFTSTDALISLVSPIDIDIVGQTISFSYSYADLLTELQPITYHWRLYITWASGIRDEIISGNFDYVER
jgi:hypothetical protein